MNIFPLGNKEKLLEESKRQLEKEKELLAKTTGTDIIIMYLEGRISGMESIIIFIEAHIEQSHALYKKDLKQSIGQKQM